MVGDILQPTHLLFIFVVALLVLGPKRLPEVARMLGNGLRDFRSAISGESRDDHDDDEDDAHPEQQAIAQTYEEIHQEGPATHSAYDADGDGDGDELDHMRIYAEHADTDAPQAAAGEPAAKPEPGPAAAKPEPEPAAAKPEPEPVAAKPEPEPVAAGTEPAAQADKPA